MTLLDYRDLARARVDALAGTARRWLADGASGNYAAAALIGFAAFGLAILGQEGAAPASANSVPPDGTPNAQAPSTLVGLAPPTIVEWTKPAALIRDEPKPRVSDLLLTYEVDYYWPNEPQTVATPTRIRARPENGASVLDIAAPGQRLRINGRIRAGGTEWYRVRLPDARDGYFVAGNEVVDLVDFRRRRAATARAEAAESVAIQGAAASNNGNADGAPLGASLSAPPADDDSLLPFF